MTNATDELRAAMRARETQGTKPRVICGWCGVLLRDGTIPVSHGMCPTCHDKMMAEEAEAQMFDRR